MNCCPYHPDSPSLVSVAWTDGTQTRRCDTCGGLFRSARRLPPTRRPTPPAAEPKKQPKAAVIDWEALLR